jgi:hypothetical protein
MKTNHRKQIKNNNKYTTITTHIETWNRTRDEELPDAASTCVYGVIFSKI